MPNLYDSLMNPSVTDEPEETPSALSYEPTNLYDSFKGASLSDYSSGVESSPEPTQPLQSADNYGEAQGDFGSLIDNTTYDTAKYFQGSGIPTAVSGIASSYYWMNEMIGKALDANDFEAVARTKKEWWDEKRKDFTVAEMEENPIDNPMLLINPMWYNYQLGKMAPAAVAGLATGGAAGSVVAGTLMSSPEAAQTYDEVLKETGDVRTAIGSAAYNFAINTTLESFGFGKILAPGGKLLSRLTSGAVTEGGTEFSQTFLDDIQKRFWIGAADGLSVPEITEQIKKDLPTMLKEAGGAGITGAAMGGATKGMMGESAESISNEDIREILRESGVPEENLPERTLEVPPGSELERVLDRNARETSLEATVGQHTDSVDQSTNQSSTERQATQAQDVLAENPIEALPTDESPQGAATEPTTEQGLQQQAETTAPIGEASQTNVSQELPSEPIGQLTLERDQVGNVPIQESLPEDSQGLSEQSVTPADLVSEAQQRMQGQSGTVLLPAMDADPYYTKEEMDEAKAKESPTIQKILDYDTSKPLTPYVKMIKSEALDWELRERLVTVLGEDARSMSLASLVTKAGPTTVKNLVNDIVKENRLGLIEQERESASGSSESLGIQGEVTQGEGVPIGSIGPRTFPISTATSAMVPNVSESLDPSVTTSTESVTGSSLEENVPYDPITQDPITQDELDLARAKEDKWAHRLLKATTNAMSFYKVVKKFGIVKEVTAELNKIAPTTQKSPTALYSSVGPDVVRKAIYRVLDRKRREAVIQSRKDRASIKPKTKALTKIEEQMEETRKARETKESKKSEPTPEQIEERAAKSRQESEDFLANQEDKSEIDKALEAGRATKKDFTTWAKTYFQGAVEVLRRIHTKLGGLMKRFEAKVLTLTKERQKKIQPFIEIWKKMNDHDRHIVSKALQNYHKKEERKNMDDYLKEHPELEKPFADVREVLEELSHQALQTGILGDERHRLRKAYFPNRVKDLDGLMEYIASEVKGDTVMIKELRKFVGDPTLTEEQAKDVFMKMLEGGQVPPMFLNPSSAKGRTIWSIKDEMQKFYYNPAEALEYHIKEMTEAIEQRKIVGVSRIRSIQNKIDNLSQKLQLTEGETVKLSELQAALKDAAEITDEDLKDFITKATLGNTLGPTDQKLAIAMFKARFNQKPTNKTLSALKDLSLISALGQFGSTITQIADIAPLIQEYGFLGAIEAITGEKSLKKEDVDINNTYRDLNSAKTTSALLDAVLKTTLFMKVDGFFASSTMQAAMNRGAKMSEVDFKKKFEDIFGSETQQLHQDLKDGKTNPLTTEFAVIELSETRPLFPSDLPAGYMGGGAWRILYALKAWNLKTLNNVYRDVSKAYREEGLPSAAMKALRYAFLLSMAGAASDAIKDILLGNPVDVPERVVDNLLKLIFLNRYNIDKFWKGDIASTLTDYFAPPLGYIEKPIEDINKAFQKDGAIEWKTLQEVPIAGKILWSQFTDAGKKKGLTKQREAVFGLLKDATLEGDGELMTEFHKKKQEYNKKVSEWNKGKNGDELMKKITTDSISAAKKRYRKESK